MTQAEYARHRNVSRQAVNKALKAGKFRLRESDGKTGIDPAEADLALGLSVSRVRADDADEPASPSGYAGPGEHAAPGLTSARTFEAVYNGRMAQLKYEKEVGRLRPIEQTEQGAARCGEAILRAIEGLPGRPDDLTRTDQQGRRRRRPQRIAHHGAGFAPGDRARIRQAGGWRRDRRAS